MLIIKIWTAVSLLLALILFSGCSRVNKENYDMLKIGMEYVEVEKILGKPGYCNSVFKSKRCTWGNDNKHIKIAFISDRVVFFEGEGL